MQPLPSLRAESPLFAAILSHTEVSLIPGISGAGRSPEDTWKTPLRDAAYILSGGPAPRCPTPASVTRSALHCAGAEPLFLTAGLAGSTPFFSLSLGGAPGKVPSLSPAVPDAEALYMRGQEAGRFLGRSSDLLVLGECVPGGTTTALCVLRALSYDSAGAGSSLNENPMAQKKALWEASRRRAKEWADPIDVVRQFGDPMIAAAAGIAKAYPGTLVLAGGTQMLAVAALVKALGAHPPLIATTSLLREDRSAGFEETCRIIGAEAWFASLPPGPAAPAGRGCIWQVKEGMGAGGAVLLALLSGCREEEIEEAILGAVRATV